MKTGGVNVDAKTFKPVDPADRGQLAPGAELTDSPLKTGGAPAAQGSEPLDNKFPGLTGTPGQARRVGRNMRSVRKRGWVTQRAQARSRFSNIASASGGHTHCRALEGLKSRGGLLKRVKQGAVRRRLNHRGHVR